MEGLSNVNIKLTNNEGISVGSTVIGQRYNSILFLRKNVYEFIKETLSKIYSCDVLEIGPRTKKQDDDLSKASRSYAIYTKEILETQDNTYKTCDLDSEVDTDYNIDVNNLPEITGQAFDVIICCEVMEHSPEFWKFPETFNKLLRKNGRIFISTPFYFRQHEPKPDYWRFTEDALNLLFSPYFDIEITKLLWKYDDGQTPIHLTLEGEKKECLEV
jgi:SAM-dependent methyltransferase